MNLSVSAEVALRLETFAAVLPGADVGSKAGVDIFVIMQRPNSGERLATLMPSTLVRLLASM